jgi:putative transposase
VFVLAARAANLNEEVVSTMRSFGILSKRTSFRSPWQNGVAERWVGNCSRDLLDHVIVLNERHLKRLMTAYVRYYHEDRTHVALEKRTPAGRVAAADTNATCEVLAMPRVGGLNHRYSLAV